MTAHRITYEGPSSLAIGAATAVADADGVELTSAGAPEILAGAADRVHLELAVEGAAHDVAAAVRLVGDGLPADARLTVEVA